MYYRAFLLPLTAAIAAFGQTPQPAAVPTVDAKEIPPRASASDYQAHAQAGKITIGAEFMGHSIAVPDGLYSTEDYVAVEVGLFGPADAPVTVATEDFSLRVNGKKMPLPSLKSTVVLSNLKDPNWEPPAASKSKGSGITTSGGGGGGGDAPPTPPKMPFADQRAMQQRVQKAALREGDRTLPEAGLLFFSYHGKPKSGDSIELIYSGAAGKATLALQP